jgi:eukaryotic-like serine/threonine-protein kinase
MATIDDWPRVKPVLEEALAREGAERQAYLAQACGSDDGLRAQVERLLAARDRAANFLETPAAVLLAEPPASSDLSGQVVGCYRLESRLGVGGMGEVYRAHDLRLNRDVALKVLPEAFAADPDRVQRFKREAQLLASLNHPHIAAIYGFEESGATRALVLELVEGPTLADRIAQGPLAFEEALPIARQIAAAIEAAHEYRVIHRDLKPANIKLRPDGTVKVLDFGLAEAFEPGPVDDASAPGRIGGTAAYMSPEQARGKHVDKRCDVWAFGCVLYEMLTGRRVHEYEPDFAVLPPGTAPSIQRLLHRCLEKDRAKRLPDMGVARLEIDDALTAPVAVASSSNRRRTAILGAVALIAILTAALMYLRSQPQESRVPVRASIALAAPLDFGVQQPAIAISPDGTRLVYRALGGGALRTRQLHERQSPTIPGTDGASNPFFSPDGESLGFFVGPALKKVSFAGGAVVTIATVPRNVGAQGYRGASWGDNGTIAFAPSTGAGLFVVSDSGGEVKPLTEIDPQANEVAHRWPLFLSGSKAILYTVKSTNLRSLDDAQIVVRSLDTGEQHSVAQGNSAQYVTADHLVYARSGALYAVPFDSQRLTVRGAPTKVIDGVVTHPESGAAQVAISRTGTLVYAAGDARTAARALLWVDRAGNSQPATDREAPYWWPRIAPDGRHIAVVMDGVFSKVWVLDVERGMLTRASQVPGDQDRAAWMPDSTHITFGADTTGRGANRLFVDTIDGSGSPTQLLDGTDSPSPFGWSPDGRSLLYREIGGATGQDVWLYSAEKRAATPYLQSAANEWSASFSPDGRWVAYVSDESGRSEIYVRPFAGDGRTQVSTEGGTAPVWSRDGRELFFAKGDTLFAVAVTLGSSFTGGAARRLFSGPYSFEEVTVNYDVSADGQRFVVPRSRVDSAPRQLELVLNWTGELLF